MKTKTTRTVILATAAVVILSLLTFACVPKVSIGGLRLGDYTFQRNEISNLRWEMIQAVPLHPSENLSLKKGEEFTVLWDKFYGLWEREGAMCTFNDLNVSTDECRVCQDCNPMGTERNILPCRQVFYSHEDIGSFEILEFPGFFTMPENARSAYRAASASFICPTDIKLTATEDATFQFPGPQKLFGETKVHVYTDSPKSVAYQLRRQTIDNKSYWTWSIEGIGKWIDNYSAALMVANVRIYNKPCAIDTNSGDCVVPSIAERIKPSRILFLPSFAGSVDAINEKAFRCYSADTEDAETRSYIDLRNCLTEYRGAPGQKLTTPTYMQGAEFDRLTWLVEFNTNEGGAVVPNDAQLIIEFAIVAK